MRYLFAIISMLCLTGGSQAASTAETYVASWREAGAVCSLGATTDGKPVPEKQMKEACITFGVLTTRLTDAGFCLVDDATRWVECSAPSNVEIPTPRPHYGDE